MRTAAGRDHQADVQSNPASNGTGLYAPAAFMGVTANATAPADADTALTGEITTGTLARGVTIFARTAGASSYTLTRTLTSDQTIVLAKFGLFTATTAGRMAFSTLITPTAGLVSGDQVTITDSIAQ